MEAPVYDAIGRGYARHRMPDPRIAAHIEAPLAGARRIVNVGAGAGSYEPADRPVVAVEPSRTMIRQRERGPVVQAVAERLPLRDAAFDAALAVLTVHHWSDPEGGLAELRRVAPARQVVLTWDAPVFHRRCWILRDYVPEIAEQASESVDVSLVAGALGSDDVRPVPVPHDCRDGFLAAYWRRPTAYLDPSVRGAISGFAKLDPERVERAMARLAADLDSGAWERRNRELLEVDEFDFGYRLVVAGESPWEADPRGSADDARDSAKRNRG